MTPQELIKHWSDRLLDRLLQYREGKPGFTFALRQVNRYGRLDAGHWFQGDAYYIFVGFTARGDEDNKTRSVGLVFFNLSEAQADCRVEVIFRTEPLTELVAMYRHIVSADSAYYKPNQPYYDGYKYFKDYPAGNPVENLERFLATDWPVFESEARGRGLEDVFFVQEPDFLRHLDRINGLREGSIVSEPAVEYARQAQADTEPEIEIIDESSGEDDTEITHPFDASKIDIRMMQLSLDQLVRRLKRHQINLYPEYQRLPGLWKPERMSQLIESLLIRLPLPVFYFDGSSEVWEVVDGLQRLSAFKRFMVDEGDNALRLTGLEYLTEYNGRTFAELPAFLQTRIEESQLLIYIINPGTPDDIKYNIFKRINTGGLILTPQEIRNALNQGVPAKMVREMADYEEFRRATSYRIPKERMEDCDFVTRFIGFYGGGYSNYQPDLDTWLNKGLAQLKKKTEAEREQIKADFKKAMNAAFDLFGDDAFRKRYDEADRRKPINKALFDTWSVNLAPCSTEEITILKHRKHELRQGFIELMNIEEFDSAVSRSTGDVVSVRRRFEGVAALIQRVLNG